MNKIVVNRELIESKNIDSAIDITLKKKESLFDISIITINISDDTTLYLDINTDTTKLKIDFNVNSNISFKLYINVYGNDSKIRYAYNIDENSLVSVIKYNRVDNIKEMVEVNLNGINANIDYLFKSICTSKELYDYMIMHNTKNTVSNIKNNLVNVSGTSSIQISSSVDKGITDCTCNQFNRIINLTNNKCEIRPILYIDNDLVDANHSALIGDFEEDELFYLESRGIDKSNAYNLLIKGFLNSGIDDVELKKKIEDDLNKYRR